ncbi:MAG: hypothetical protein AAB036_12005 [Elusimicrobiota bacterium]
MKRSIELYGRLRDAGLGASLRVDIPAGANVRGALKALKISLGAKASLIDGCALATADAVLADGDRLPSGRLALLPPVCGG